MALPDMRTRLAMMTDRGPWLAGAAVGFLGGAAALTVSPAILAVEVVLVTVLAAMPPRLSGVAGTLVGHGVAWSVLLATSWMTCEEACDFSLPFGPAHIQETWVSDTRTWLLAALALLIGGLVLTFVRRIRWDRRGPHQPRDIR